MNIPNLISLPLQLCQSMLTFKDKSKLLPSISFILKYLGKIKDNTEDMLQIYLESKQTSMWLRQHLLIPMSPRSHVY